MVWETSKLDQLKVFDSEGIQFRNLKRKYFCEYSEGMNKKEYWEATYDDTMNLIAKLRSIAAYIYRKTYHGGDHIEADNNLDWAANFAHMLDHEGGNASAHTVHLEWVLLQDHSTDLQIKSICPMKHWNAGKVVPGYGHAVLRRPDPRFVAQKVYADEYIKNDDIVNVVGNIFDVVHRKYLKA
ncbi:unnamed protein product [Bathycoccus prasinos]